MARRNAGAASPASATSSNSSDSVQLSSQALAQSTAGSTAGTDSGTLSSSSAKRTLRTASVQTMASTATVVASRQSTDSSAVTLSPSLSSAIQTLSTTSSSGTSPSNSSSSLMGPISATAAITAKIPTVATPAPVVSSSSTPAPTVSQKAYSFRQVDQASAIAKSASNFALGANGGQIPAEPLTAEGQAKSYAVKQALGKALEAAGLDPSSVRITYWEQNVWYPDGSYINRYVTVQGPDGRIDNFNADLTLASPHVTVDAVKLLFAS